MSSAAWIVFVPPCVGGPVRGAEHPVCRCLDRIAQRHCVGGVALHCLPFSGQSVSAEDTIATLSHQLDQTYRSVAGNLPNNTAARVETSDGKDELVLTGLDKLDDPPSLVRLREAVNGRLPRVDLPEILLEIAARTDFTSKFAHVSERESRVGDLSTSLCAVLIAEACNIGLEPLIRNDVPALRRSRLSWVNQNRPKRKFDRCERLSGRRSEPHSTRTGVGRR